MKQFLSILAALILALLITGVDAGSSSPAQIEHHYLGANDPHPALVLDTATAPYLGQAGETLASRWETCTDQLVVYLPLGGPSQCPAGLDCVPVTVTYRDAGSVRWGVLTWDAAPIGPPGYAVPWTQSGAELRFRLPLVICWP